jgi:hypothetical protein
MTSTNAVIATSAWFEDSSGAIGNYPDLIRTIAQQQPWKTLHTNNTTDRDELSETSGETRDKLDTALRRDHAVSAHLFPDKPRTQPVEPSFYPLQEWEGYVIDIADDVFTARLVDLTAGDEQEEEADFPIAELSIADKNQLRPGAIFRWATRSAGLPAVHRSRCCNSSQADRCNTLAR